MAVNNPAPTPTKPPKTKPKPVQAKSLSMRTVVATAGVIGLAAWAIYAMGKG